MGKVKFLRNQNYRRRQYWWRPRFIGDKDDTIDSLDDETRANTWWDNMIGNNNAVGALVERQFYTVLT